VAHSFKLPGGKPSAASQRDDWLGGYAQAMHYCATSVAFEYKPR